MTDCPECAACDAIYDAIEDVAGGLGRSAHERDAEGFLRDAQAAMSRAADALRRHTLTTQRNPE